MRKLTVLSLVAVFAVSLALPAVAAVDYEGQVTSRIQSLEGENNNNTWDQSAGFSDVLFNLQVYGDVASGVDAYVELQSSSAADQVDAYEAYITHTKLIPMVNAKMGRFELNFGNQRMRGSDNADVQSNNLIGNALVDPAVAQTGLELSGQYMEAAWSLSATNGVSDMADQNFSDSRGLALTAKVWGDILPGLSAAASYHSVAHDKDAVESNFGLNDFAAEAYSVDGVAESISLAEQPGEARPEVDAMQLDLTYDMEMQGIPAELYVNYGTIEANDASGATQNDVTYQTVEGRYDLTPASYLALRWGKLTDDELTTDDTADRMQVGVGQELAPNTLAKLEYVQDSKDWNNEAEFSGVIGELSVSF